MDHHLANLQLTSLSQTWLTRLLIFLFLFFIKLTQWIKIYPHAYEIVPGRKNLLITIVFLSTPIGASQSQIWTCNGHYSHQNDNLRLWSASIIWSYRWSHLNTCDRRQHTRKYLTGWHHKEDANRCTHSAHADVVLLEPNLMPSMLSNEIVSALSSKVCQTPSCASDKNYCS